MGLLLTHVGRQWVQKITTAVCPFARTACLQDMLKFLRSYKLPVLTRLTVMG